MQQSRNIAARAGRWSARHRKTAILGWLAFVSSPSWSAATSARSTLTDRTQPASASPAQPTAVVDDAFPEQAERVVLIQSDDAHGRRPAVPRRRRRRDAHA